MSWCSAFGCSNNSKRDKEKSFFRLPGDPNVRNAWVKAINRTELPKKVLLCSDHFTENCFDKSWSLQNELFYTERTAKRKLVPGSLPTIFPHKPRPKERQTSKKRAEKKSLKEVHTVLKIIPRLIFKRYFVELFYFICNPLQGYRKRYNEG